MSKNIGLILTDFKSIAMSSPIEQEYSCEFLCFIVSKAYAVENKMRDEEANQYYESMKVAFSRYAVSPKYIKQRRLGSFSGAIVKIPEVLKVNGDFTETDLRLSTNQSLITEHKNPRGLEIQDKMSLFNDIAIKAMDRFYLNNDNISLPNDIVHVTCAGYLAPSPIQVWLSRNQQFKTVVTNSYHMGCYAAIPSMRTAAGLLASAQYGILAPKQRVDLVHTEYLTLHLDLLGGNIDNIISMTLFADGFIKYSMVPQLENTKSGLKIISMHEEMLPNSTEEMKLILGANYFFLTLSAQVPHILQKHIAHFIKNLIAASLNHCNQNISNLYFAIHPGGPKILDLIQEELKLSDKQLFYSRKVLKENGNMASATVPHVLQMMLEDDEVPKNAMILSMACGPGMVATGMILQKL